MVGNKLIFMTPFEVIKREVHRNQGKSAFCYLEVGNCYCLKKEREGGQRYEKEWAVEQYCLG